MSTFRTTLDSNGKTATGFVVPPDVVAALGKGKRPPVRVTIGAHTYRSTIAVMGGQYLVGVSADNRRAAGVAAGDGIEVTLELDAEPRELTVPADLAAALAAAPAAAAAFAALSYSQRQRYVLAVDGAKTAETRQRRIVKAVAELGPQ
jgi:hypothetical protein